MKRLGIDLGTSSLGWAILDDDRINNAPRGTEAPNVIDCGVVVFPEGMDRDKSGNLNSRAAERRLKRAQRRTYRRRRYRKFHILKALIENDMCPMSMESLNNWKKYDKENEGQGKYPIYDKAFMEWLKVTPEKNPYVDRKLAAEEPVDKYCFGRAIYHIAQRRGFKSSKKELLAEFEAEENNSTKAKTETELGKVKKEIKKLGEQIGEQTLGQYFYRLYQKGEKIRGKKIDRKEHYEKEFDVICDVQKAIVSNELRELLRSILFYQRPLRIQRHLVGYCELEKGKKYKRCLISHPSFERFRALCFINNFKIRHNNEEDYIGLTEEQREFILKKMERVTPFKDGVRSLMVEFNKKYSASRDLVWVSNYRETADVPILEVTARFKSLNISESDWQKALNASVDFDDLHMLEDWSKKCFNFDEKQARTFVRINPSTDRARYSLRAISFILPWLEEGRFLSEAIFLAKMPMVIPNWEENKQDVLDIIVHETNEYHKEKEKYKYSSNAPKLDPLNERIKTSLKKYCESKGMSKENFDKSYSKLYVDSSVCNVDNPTLPPVDMGSIKNPMVLHSLTMLRRLVNTLRFNGKIDANTQINIELARTVNSANECRAIEQWNVDLASKRDKAREELSTQLTEHNLNPVIDDDLILRYLLWEEQDHCSVYTGQHISFKEMVQDCDIEHTLPRARGGTNEQANLTLCESHYNRNIKLRRLPCECPNSDTEWFDVATNVTYPAIRDGRVMKHWKNKLDELEKNCDKNRGGSKSDMAAYAKRRQRYLRYDIERKYWKKKIGMFNITAEKASETSFMPRQLVDTGSITKFAVEFLKQRYPKVYPCNGAVVSYARKAWGLQAEDEKKDRNDHTHHAVDAIVIAAIDRERFSQICSVLGSSDWNCNITCPPPYENFGELAYKARESILVRHIPLNRKLVPFQEKAVRKNLRLATPIKTSDGNMLYKVTSSGRTVRGSLHEDSYYGKIIKDGKEIPVIRKTIASAKNLDELKNWAKSAVDAPVRETLLVQIKQYEEQGLDVKKIPLIGQFWGPKDKNGTPDVDGIPLKKIRIIYGKNPEKIRDHVTKGSEPSHNCVYGLGGDLLELVLSSNSKKNISLMDKVNEEISINENDMVIRPGMAVLFYEKDKEELYNLSNNYLSKRLYFVRKFGDDGRVTFWLHREARASTVLSDYLQSIGKNKAGQSKIDFNCPHELLRLSGPGYINNIMLEGRDFVFDLDGQISFINND